MKNLFRVLSINLAVLTALFLTPSLLYRLHRIKTARANLDTVDKRAFYPTYENKNFAIQVWNDEKKTDAEYKSFIGWKTSKLESQFINIGGPYNTRKSSGERINGSTWFFGGSTIFGHGVSDYQTIPSYYNSITNIPVYNFGDVGWTSRQSLNQLITVIADQNMPSFVIFYDGGNDVGYYCRTEISSIPIHAREAKIQKIFKRGLLKSKLKNFILAPYKAIAYKLNKDSPASDSRQSFYNCNNDKNKARLIAQHLATNWHSAFLISRSRDAKFYAILQPTLFTTNTNFEYFHPSEKKNLFELKKQFKVVYPLILEEVEKICKKDKDFCAAFINATDWLNGRKNIFLDFIHLGPYGNKVMAEEILRVIQK